jgi:hypothetical protein
MFTQPGIGVMPQPTFKHFMSCTSCPTLCWRCSQRQPLSHNARKRLVCAGNDGVDRRPGQLVPFNGHANPCSSAMHAIGEATHQWKPAA